MKHTELDEALRNIVWPELSPPSGDPIKLIADIKKCFQDAGYIQDLPKIQDGTLYPLVWAKANGYKTGKEWFDNFNKELGEYQWRGNNQLLEGARNAARRASGLLEKE